MSTLSPAEIKQLQLKLSQLEARVAKLESVLQVSPGAQAALVVGNARVVLKRDGTVEIAGRDVSITSSGRINVKASSDLVMKGQKILNN